MCAICAKPIVAGEARYTVFEPDRFMHYNCHRPNHAFKTEPSMRDIFPKLRATAGDGPIASALTTVLAKALSRHLGVPVSEAAISSGFKSGYTIENGISARWGAYIQVPDHSLKSPSLFLGHDDPVRPMWNFAHRRRGPILFRGFRQTGLKTYLFVMICNSVSPTASVLEFSSPLDNE